MQYLKSCYFQDVKLDSIQKTSQDEFLMMPYYIAISIFDSVKRPLQMGKIHADKIVQTHHKFCKFKEPSCTVALSPFAPA